MSGAQVERYRRGDVLFRQGEAASRLFRTETGLVRLFLTTGRGRTVTVRHVLPGDYFGEDTLSGRPYLHAAQALTGTQVVRVDPHDLDREGLLELARNLGAQLRRAMSHEVHVQSGDLRQRVVRYLLELVDTPLGSEDAENRLFVRATHELLAEGSGSTRESVSKIVTELRESGLLDTGYRHITLLNLDGLRSIALVPQQGSVAGGAGNTAEG